MTLGEKLRSNRKQAGLSQEQLAEKLCVSRQAITKWESGKGTPDIENIKNIAALFNVSIDSLLSDEEISFECIKEPVNMENYEKTGKCRSKYDAVVKEKYGDAKVIYPLIRKKKLNAFEWIADFLTAPGIIQSLDYTHDMSAYYVVELEHKQLFVNVTKEYMETREMNKRFDDGKLIIGDNKFTKAPYTL